MLRVLVVDEPRDVLRGAALQFGDRHFLTGAPVTVSERWTKDVRTPPALSRASTRFSLAREWGLDLPQWTFLWSLSATT